MFCSQCVKHISDDSRFCRYCGKPTEPMKNGYGAQNAGAFSIPNFSQPQPQQPAGYGYDQSPNRQAQQGGLNYGQSINQQSPQSANYTAPYPSQPVQGSFSSIPSPYAAQPATSSNNENTKNYDDYKFEHKNKRTQQQIAAAAYKSRPFAWTVAAFLISLTFTFIILLYVDGFYDYKESNYSSTTFADFMVDPIYRTLPLIMTLISCVLSCICLFKPRFKSLGVFGFCINIAVFFYMTIVPIIGTFYTLKNYDYVIFLTKIFYFETAIATTMCACSYASMEISRRVYYIAEKRDLISRIKED